MISARRTGEKSSLFAVREISLPVEKLLQALLGLAAERRVSILDSGGARPPDARFLIAGFDPSEIVEARGDELRVSRPREAKEIHLRGDALVELDKRLQTNYAPRVRDDLRFPTCACIATFSYDLARRLERLRFVTPRPLAAEPDAVLAFYDTLVIHDYLKGTTAIVSVAGPLRADEFENDLSNAAKLREDESFESFFSSEHCKAPTRVARSNFTRDEYLLAVDRIKAYIAAGDIYQANLTQQLSVSLDDSLRPEQIFLRLRRAHPASFAAFIRRRDDVVISASPERFLRVSVGETERTVEAWPIKGTRPRGTSAEEDARLRTELEESEKDRAENIMIVDLMRNDLGRVARYGTVSVPELFTVQEHPTLFHLVSKVRATLREDVSAGELLRATFPCGSITGAPKLRAMEILDMVERAPRGLSMGAIGYFSFDGAIDLSVAIRTMTVRNRTARFNVGGGIVADSRPEHEYEESLTKARALLHALDAQL